LMLKDFFKTETSADKIESISFLLLIVAAVFTVFGISVGTFVPGIPVAIAIAGAFMVPVSIVLYVISEFLRMLDKKSK